MCDSLLPIFSQRVLAQNQIQPDNSLKNEISIVTNKAEAQLDWIQGGARRGSVLFHSFKAFNVGLGGEAAFANPKGVRNILTRVTGPLRSEILGTLGVGGKANLIFLNPNGVYFGPESRADIAGSLLVSSDSALDLGDGVLFRADTSPVPSLLTLRVPSGVQLGRHSGTIVNRGILQSGKDLTLSGDRLNLSGEILAERDLLLQGNQVLIREHDRAFRGAAGRTLRIDGHDRVDIDALKFSESGLFSGGDLVLRSARPIVADAHFVAGRHLRFEGWKGEFGDIISRTDPVVLANGNVTLGDYTGASLHILAGGSVRLGNVTITESGPIESTINPENQTQINQNLTYGDLASFELSGFELKKNQKGGLDQIPTQETIKIDGHQQATLDVRAGVDWEALGRLPNSLVSGKVSPIPNPEEVVNSAITIEGDVKINQPRGRVLLTNRFHPNAELQEGAIAGQTIDTSVEEIELDAGDVSILSRGDILTSFIDASSTVVLDENDDPLNRKDNSGKGGNVLISSLSGKINNNKVISYSKGNIGRGGDIRISSLSGYIKNPVLNSGSFAKFGNSSQGGDITVSSISGNIHNQDLQSASFSRESNSDRGGDITVASISGSIRNQNLRSASTSFYKDSGRGGDIIVSSVSGKIYNIGNKNQPTLRSASISRTGHSARGGDIMVSSISGNIDNQNFQSISFSRLGNSGLSGKISVSSRSGNIDNNNFLSTSSSINGNAGKGGDIIVISTSGNIRNQYLRAASISGNIENQNQNFSDGNSGKGGNIMVSSTSGNIYNQTLQSTSFSNIGSSGNSGDITVSSTSGNIHNQYLRAASSSRNGNSGNGGNITVSSTFGNIHNQNLRAASSSVSDTGNSGNGGNITLSSISGNIRLQGDVANFSYSRNRQAGKSGSISVTAKQGSIQGLNQSSAKTRLLAFSIGAVDSNSGGQIDLMGQSVRNLELLTLSSSDQSGDVNISGQSQSLVVKDLDIIANAKVEVDISSPLDDFADSIQTDTSEFGASGTVTISSPRHAKLENVKIESNSNGSKDAGNIKLVMPESLELSNSDILTNANNIGRAGNITIFAKDVTLEKNSQLSAKSIAQGDGGSINLNLERLTLSQDSEVSTSTTAAGDGGEIFISSSNNLSIQGKGEITSDSTDGGGTAGGLTLSKSISNGRSSSLNSINIKDTILSVNSKTTAGNLDVNAKTLILDNATLSAKAGQGKKQGSINLKIRDLLLLINNSQISAEASNQATGGNIFIDSPSGFIVSLPSTEDGNDIIAKAQAGRGGDITINAKEIFGFTGTNAFPNNKANDIDASSQSNLQGVVKLNTPGIEPNEKIPSLISTFSPPRLKESCQQNEKNTFVNINLGGQIPKPSDHPVFPSWDDVRPVSASQHSMNGMVSPAVTPLAEAQGWIQDSDSNIQLVAPHADQPAIALKPSPC